MRTSRALTLAFALAAIFAFAATGPAQALTPAPAPFPYCSWWVKTTPQAANVAFPDSAATYWTTPFRVQAGLNIEVAGVYPTARYMSFNVYDSSFGTFTAYGLSSGKADYLLAPNAGAVNPFQQPGRPGGAFAATLTSDPSSATTPNVLPIAPEGTADGTLGFLVFRVYLPKGGNGTVALPSLTLVQNGQRTTLPPCRDGVPPVAATNVERGQVERATGTASGGTKPCRGRACPPPLRFFRPQASTTNSFFPNVDNAYVAMLVRPRAGEVVVIRGKAPTHAPGERPSPWGDPPRWNLRYWSLCNNLYVKPWPVVANRLPDGSVDYGCRSDLETRVDRSGRYTYVLGPESAANAIRAKRGATFVPFSTRTPRVRSMVAFRNMLGQDFPQSVQHVPEDGRPSSAARTMGAYYPRAHRCTLEGFLRDGASCRLSR